MPEPFCRFRSARRSPFLETLPALFFFFLLSLLAPALRAQDEAPPPKSGNLRITFLPPPMEGALSLGIYNKAGKLIRALHSHAVADKDFAVGLNGLSTHWDGKDDAGNPAPAGKYAARGFCVGALEVEGVAYHCNDWMTADNSPRVRRITGIAMTPEDDLLVSAQLLDDHSVTLRVAADGKVTVQAAASDSAPQPDAADASPESGKRFAVRDGKIVPAGEGIDPEKAQLLAPIESAEGTHGALWVIDRTPEGAEIKQFAADGEFLRRLAIPAGEPPPQHIAASKTRDFIALVETGPREQRLRALALESAAAKDADGVVSSTWKTLFSKTIFKSDDFPSVADKLGRDKPFTAEEKVRVRLLPNPLFKDAMHDLDVRVAVDARGSSLTTSDGLPLCRFTETPHLKWVAMGHDGNTKAITIFQSDGAVVEEFRARKLANMMAFDAGEYEWSGK